MNEYKIEYRPQYLQLRYAIYRKEYRWFGMNHTWHELAICDTLEKAEETLKELKDFPKYYRY